MLTSSLFHSKPPVAIITPRRAFIVSTLLLISISIPVILFPSLINLLVFAFNCGSISLSRQPFKSAPTNACPKPLESFEIRSDIISSGTMPVPPPKGVSPSVIGSGEPLLRILFAQSPKIE